jgi:hypothetical protein
MKQCRLMLRLKKDKQMSQHFLNIIHKILRETHRNVLSAKIFFVFFQMLAKILFLKK